VSKSSPDVTHEGGFKADMISPVDCQEWRTRFYKATLLVSGKKSASRYDIALNNFLKRFPEKKKLTDFYRADLEDYKLLRTRDGISGRTINYEITVVKAFWNWVIDANGVEIWNPAGKVKRVREPQQKKKSPERGNAQGSVRCGSDGHRDGWCC
jgi:site-specific recombinase XerD